MTLRVTWIILLLCFVHLCSAQGKKIKKEDKLFTVEGKPVTTDEFIYLFKKNHPGGPEEYTEKSINEYLDLFVNFKLKVNEAKHRGMDTTTAFISEFTSYRDELLKPYLPDAKIIDSLVSLTYARLKQEVRASHILITLTKDATPADTLEAYEKIMNLRKRALNGEDFEELAKQNSMDPSARNNGGDLGYFTALQMVYPFENAAYNTPVGDISMPVRTQFGYHLVKVTNRKPARGEVEVSHIMLRTRAATPDKIIDQNALKNKIFEIHDQLIAGVSWEELCEANSEDQSSKDKGGRLRPFGVGAMASVPEFEKVAFSLEKPGDISDPFQTAYGWHIIRLERKSPLPPLEEMMPQLKNRVSKDERLKISKQEWQEKFKKRYQFKENQSIKSALLSQPDSLLFKQNISISNETLFSFQGQPTTVAEFLKFARKKVQGLKPDHQIAHLYDEYVDKRLLDMLESQISKENADFDYLIKEYYEGILLFEIMEKEVWNKASEDSVGLEQYFNKHKADYVAGERLKGDLFYTEQKGLMDSLKMLVESRDSLALHNYVSNKGIKRESGSYEKKDRSIFSQIPWAKGIYSLENNGIYYLAWIYDILPPGPKTFDEARATVIADYQQELEKKWVEQLKKQYPVKINEKGRKYVLAVLKK